MSDTGAAPGHDSAGPDGHDVTCEHVLEQVWAFLDHEIDDASADQIRAHLVACEPCLDHFDVEQAVKALVGRCCGNDRAPEHLRAKVISSYSVTVTETRITREL